MNLYINIHNNVHLVHLKIHFIVHLNIHTGCFGMTAKKFELITRGSKQPITWERCHFVN